MKETIAITKPGLTVRQSFALLAVTVVSWYFLTAFVNLFYSSEYVDNWLLLFTFLAAAYPVIKREDPIRRWSGKRWTFASWAVFSASLTTAFGVIVYLLIYFFRS